ncbi:DUF2785 domain-containing protein [Bacillus sp. RG28]|uniref:DUF2785 domain-containing protein n=1 Tax=Gottfriedia endophytica TaxID=2820819 RepID=A0A940SGT8_9BACI|nr:DUF2785 domain-containing protein [Gottfriedia endophytica]MBP0725447.1 DUF2785 domain-containing protein [Gottfriedia endophytica]
MVTEKLLKEKLMKLKENNYILTEEENAYDLAIEMLKNIGSVDPVLRDDLIYSILSKWMINDVFTTEQLQHLLFICIDENHLHYKLGEINTDSIFTRSFSILITAVILYKENETSFLTSKDIENVKEKIFQYAIQENDIRGYDEEKGWAHSIAHLADCLDELAKNHQLNQTDLQMMLEIICTRIMESKNVFTCEEDERMVTAVCAIIERNLLSEEDIKNWIVRFKDYKKTDDYNKNYNIKINSKHFLRSLYFRLKPVEKEKYSMILKALDELNTY